MRYLSAFVFLNLLILAFASALLVSRPASAQAQSGSVIIHAPLPGQVLRGSVPVVITSAVDGFAASELSFGYTGDPTGTWFLIAQSNEPLQEAVLAQWDTTTLTDGVYTLRLAVTMQDASQVVVTVPNLRVRNYTPVETDTPTPVTPSATLAPWEATLTLTPTGTPVPPTPTPLPTNPAVLTATQIAEGAGRGTLAALAAFLLLGLYLTARHSFRKRD